LIDYQQEISQKFQILVKIKYVKNQGYLIEVSKKDVKKFEEQMKNFLNSQTFSEQDSQKFSFLRKQTLKIAERYVSPYLKQLEEKILSATYELQEKEKEILEQWKDILY
jgi:DNA mismatch repair ATPase MutS